MVARRGDFTRAIELTREIDKLSKTSPMGALLRARIYAAQGKPRDLAQAYKEALERAPRQLELRVLLGQTKLKLGEADEALRQANMVLDVEKNRPDALLLQARAMAETGTTPTEKDQQQRAGNRPARSGHQGQSTLRRGVSHAGRDSLQAHQTRGRRRRLEGRPEGQSHRRHGRFTACRDPLAPPRRQPG